MLRDALIRIAEMAGDHYRLSHGGVDLPLLKKLCSKARETWAFAVFDTRSDEQLRRYFTYHMTVLTQITGRDDPCGCNAGFLSELTGLADHLFTYYHRFLEQNTMLSRAFLQLRIENLRKKITQIPAMARERMVSYDLTAVLEHMLVEISGLPDRKACTAGSLSYAESFTHELYEVLRLAGPANAETLVSGQLIAMNFNHIRFFLYLENQLKDTLSKLPVTEGLEELRRQKVFFEQLRPAETYAANWKPIGEMMRCWIAEEIASVTEAGRAEQVFGKLGFNLSVAQLACLTRAFFNAGVYLSENINAVFTLSTRYFYSRKQANISKGSFSKEYYSVSQKTAAHVLDLLQKMAARIRKDYFPVLFVISAAHLFCPGSGLTH